MPENSDRARVRARAPARKSAFQFNAIPKIGQGHGHARGHDLADAISKIGQGHDLAYNTRLLIAYEGTSFSGWQIQPNGISIQSLLEQALAKLLRARAPVRVIGSGRTDAGVHAQGQVAHFRHEQPINPCKLLHALNALLPPAIRILQVLPTHLKFHAQHDAVGKIYHYYFQLAPVPNPFLARYTLQLYRPIDLALIREALPLFIGTHDFTSFANEAHKGSAQKDPIRTLRRVDLTDCGGGRWCLEFEGDGFLYKMVRNITGTLLEIGQGKRKKESIPALFATRSRSHAATAAPAHGLSLIKVFYLTDCDCGASPPSVPVL